MNSLLRFASLMLAATVVAAPAQVSSIRQVDFKNLSYPWDEPGGVPSDWHWMTRASQTRVRLADGIRRFSQPGDSEYDRARAPGVWMTSVTYGDIDDDQKEEAAVALNYTTGGTVNWVYLFIYKLDRGVPRLLGRLESGSRADGGLVKTAIENGRLALDFADTERRIADCCSEGFIRVRYQWRQGRFVETGPRQHGDMNLDIRPLSP